MSEQSPPPHIPPTPIKAIKEGLYIFGSNLKYRCGVIAIRKPTLNDSPLNNNNNGDTTTTTTTPASTTGQQQQQSQDTTTTTNDENAVVEEPTIVNALESFDRIYHLNPNRFFGGERIKFASAAYTYTLVMTHSHRLLVAGGSHMFFEGDTDRTPFPIASTMLLNGINSRRSRYDNDDDDDDEEEYDEDDYFGLYSDVYNSTFGVEPMTVETDDAVSDVDYEEDGVDEEDEEDEFDEDEFDDDDDDEIEDDDDEEYSSSLELEEYDEEDDDEQMNGGDSHCLVQEQQEQQQPQRPQQTTTVATTSTTNGVVSLLSAVRRSFSSPTSAAITTTTTTTTFSNNRQAREQALSTRRKSEVTKKKYTVCSAFRPLSTPPNMPVFSIQHILTLQKCVICIDDRLTFWSIGTNNHGEMGVGDGVKSLYTFTPLRPLENREFLRTQVISNEYTRHPHEFTFSNLSHVSHGAYHIILVFNGRYIYSVGFNGCGELGIASTMSQQTYQRVNVDLPSNVKHLSIGLNHNIFLLEDGSVYVNGYNAFGQLGLGNYSAVTTLTKLEDPLLVNNKICDVSTGYHHTVYLTEDYRVFACGWNKDFTILLQKSGRTYCNLVEITSAINQVCRSPFEISCGGYTIFVNKGTDVYAAGRLNEKGSFEPQGSFVHIMSGYGYECTPDSGYSHGLILCSVQSNGFLQTVSTLHQRCIDGKLGDMTIFTLR